jgi:hypothetical protein
VLLNFVPLNKALGRRSTFFRESDKDKEDEDDEDESFGIVDRFDSLSATVDEVSTKSITLEV